MFVENPLEVALDIVGTGDLNPKNVEVGKIRSKVGTLVAGGSVGEAASVGKTT